MIPGPGLGKRRCKVIKIRTRTLLMGLSLAILLGTLGAAMLAPQASGFEGNAVPAGAAYSPSADQNCYSLDTSRPEWLQSPTRIYLPLITKE